MRNLNQVIRRYFNVFSIFTVLLVIILTNTGISWIFKNYLGSIRAKENETVYELIYDAFEDNTLDTSETMILRQLGNQNGIHILILSVNDDILFDSAVTGSGGRRPMGSMGKKSIDMASLKYSLKVLEIGDNTFVQVKLGRENVWLATEEEKYFIYGINIIFILVLVIAGVSGWFLSRYLSKKIASPIIEIQEATHFIKEGDYSSVKLSPSDTIEIAELGEAVESLARKLDTQERFRKRMTTDIAHELRNPIAVIRSQLEGIADGVLEPTEERLSRLSGEIIRLTKLIDDLNELSIVENELYEVKRENFNLSKLLKEMSENFKAVTEAAGLYLEGEFDEDINYFGDKMRIAQVIGNLLSNACKYTDTGGIKVTLSSLEGNIKITVQDTGIGISKDDLPYIFERFYRADPSRNRKTGGAGIGLAIAKKIVESHGGKIIVESVLGVGTTFIIQL